MNRQLHDNPALPFKAMDDEAHDLQGAERSEEPPQPPQTRIGRPTGPRPVLASHRAPAPPVTPAQRREALIEAIIREASATSLTPPPPPQTGGGAYVLTREELEHSRTRFRERPRTRKHLRPKVSDDPDKRLARTRAHHD